MDMEPYDVPSSPLMGPAYIANAANKTKTSLVSPRSSSPILEKLEPFTIKQVKAREKKQEADSVK